VILHTTEFTNRKIRKAEVGHVLDIIRRHAVIPYANQEP
jgi:hypothetical protein